MNRPIRRVRLSYAFALALIAGIALTTQVVIQAVLRSAAADAEIINISGRQRMLSQRIAKSAFAAAEATDEVSRAMLVRELENALRLFEDSHRQLLESPVSTDAIRTRLTSLQPHFDGLVENTRRLLTTPTETLAEDSQHAILQRIRTHEAAFLPRMHETVNQYQAQSDRRFRMLKRTELQLFLLTIVVLVLEALLVFEPLRRTLSSHIEMLSESRREALAAVKAEEEFLATMSHEIRTPLNGIIATNDLMHYTELDLEQQEYIETCAKSARTLLALVDHVLDFSQLSAGKLELRPEAFAVRDLAEEVAMTVAAEISRDDVEWIVEIEDSLPTRIVGDPIRLRQVLFAIVENAAKFTEQGHIRIRASQVARGGAPWILFEVADTGTGIAEEHQEEIFGRFTQVDGSRTRASGGTGLGLAIARMLVARMSGTLCVCSTLGEGSTFRLEIPLEIPDESHPCEPEQDIDLERLEVAVIDHHEASRDLVVAQLERFGATIDAFDGDASAARMIAGRDKPYDLILVDDAIDALAHLVEDNTAADGPPMVLLTSVRRSGDERVDGPFAGRLLKPVRRDSLARTVARLFPDRIRSED